MLTMASRVSFFGFFSTLYKEILIRQGFPIVLAFNLRDDYHKFLALKERALEFLLQLMDLVL